MCCLPDNMHKSVSWSYHEFKRKVWGNSHYSQLNCLSMALTFRDRTLLVKLYYQLNVNTSVYPHEFRRLKKLPKGPTSITNLRNIIKQFETAKTIVQQPGWWRKAVSQQQVEESATNFVGEETANVQDTNSAKAVSRQNFQDNILLWNL